MLGILGILDGGPLGQTLTVKFTCFIMDLWLKTGVLKKTAISATDAEMQGSNSNRYGFVHFKYLPESSIVFSNMEKENREIAHTEDTELQILRKSESVASVLTSAEIIDCQTSGPSKMSIFNKYYIFFCARVSCSFCLINICFFNQLKLLLWDSSHNDYKNRNKKHDATQESAQSFSCDATEVMRKWKTILAQYRREKKKIADSKSSGSGFSDLYKPRWFAYAYLNLFHGRDEPNTSMNSQDEINEQLIQEEHTTVNESQESSHERPLLREIQFVSSVTIISI
ncbi:unnamed protein product [Acanthoscelides obtectus]|uniref:MADF domain-containing protein n=1 Tax=Acanthoscelides obtectus TaxID=200917 RepID=A0A9P0K486_ACAOB|nr:unnamed protein product [Acanthoscelides obtectus]CAK1668884.1 hypothetical protein AOBTE_LOCUS26661 [Acanthoscelides obtectus]